MTQETVTVGNTVYKIKQLQPTDQLGFAYELIGPRATYKLMRNQNTPHLMFPIGKNMSTPNWWISDKDGILKQVQGVTVR